MATKGRSVLLDGHSLELGSAERIAHGESIRLSSAAMKRIRASRKLVKEVAAGPEPTYGINTGFGYLARERISRDDLLKVQENIVKSHAAGTGEALGVPETRLAMALRLNLLIKGFSGCRPELCLALHKHYEAGIYPLIPMYGSVGASGDLIPLAHLALPLLGYGSVYFKGKQISARDALKKAKLKPIKLAEKEGLSFVNGTEIMQAVGALALLSALKVVQAADRLTALSYEALRGSVAPLQPQIHKTRGHKGQMLSARTILGELKGSELHSSKVSSGRVQDPYSLRCAPQIHGPSREAFDYTASVLETEMNAVTDNPIVFAAANKVISGGNFHGQPLALAYDFSSMACAELGNVSERRLELLLNPHSSGLPAFLAQTPGVQSGYMALQYLSASLVNENKLLANPSCTDSIPGNVGIEDHVSMGMTSARKFAKIVENTRTILCCEWLAASQAIDLRGKVKMGKGTQQSHEILREQVEALKGDRIVAEDITQALELFPRLAK